MSLSDTYLRIQSSIYNNTNARAAAERIIGDIELEKIHVEAVEEPETSSKSSNRNDKEGDQPAKKRTQPNPPGRLSQNANINLRRQRNLALRPDDEDDERELAIDPELAEDYALHMELLRTSKDQVKQSAMDILQFSQVVFGFRIKRAELEKLDPTTAKGILAKDESAQSRGRRKRGDQIRLAIEVMIIDPSRCSLSIEENENVSLVRATSLRTMNTTPMPLFVRIFNKLMPGLQIVPCAGHVCMQRINELQQLRMVRNMARAKMMVPLHFVQQTSGQSGGGVSSHVRGARGASTQSVSLAARELIGRENEIALNDVVMATRSAILHQFESRRTKDAAANAAFQEFSTNLLVLPPNTTLHRDEANFAPMFDDMREEETLLQDEICRSLFTYSRQLLDVAGEQKVAGPGDNSLKDYEKTIDGLRDSVSRVWTDICSIAMDINRVVLETGFFQEDLNAAESEDRVNAVMSTDTALNSMQALDIQAFDGNGLMGASVQRMEEFAMSRSRQAKRYDLFNGYVGQICSTLLDSDAPSDVDNPLCVKIANTARAPFETLQQMHAAGLIGERTFRTTACNSIGVRPARRRQNLSLAMKNMIARNPAFSFGNMEEPEPKEPAASAAKPKKKAKTSK